MSLNSDLKGHNIIVRDNLINQQYYFPYCGRNTKCFYGWPRMKFDGSQFYCQCGYRTNFELEFIKQYKEKWNK